MVLTDSLRYTEHDDEDIFDKVGKSNPKLVSSIQKKKKVVRSIIEVYHIKFIIP